MQLTLLSQRKHFKTRTKNRVVNCLFFLFVIQKTFVCLSLQRTPYYFSNDNIKNREDFKSFPFISDLSFKLKFQQSTWQTYDDSWTNTDFIAVIELSFFTVLKCTLFALYSMKGRESTVFVVIIKSRYQVKCFMGAPYRVVWL